VFVSTIFSTFPKGRGGKTDFFT